MSVNFPSRSEVSPVTRPLWRWCFGVALALSLATALAGASAASTVAGRLRGQPLVRLYPLDEIGYLPHGARLTFDSYGRVTLVQDGVYAVLNDTVWLNLAHPDDPAERKMANVVAGRDGRLYYGTRGCWGVVEYTPDGRMRGVPLRPAMPPAWTKTGFFDDIIATNDGVYFGSGNGVVFWNPTTKEATYFERPATARLVQVGERVFLSVYDQPLRWLDLASRTLRLVPGTENLAAVRFSASLDGSHTLLALADGRLMVFDGQTTVQWAAQARNGLAGRISALARLADGDIAVAISGQGVFILTSEGDLACSLTTSQYHLVTKLASREPGVLWMGAEDAIEKVLYRSPLTTFGERLGLPVYWPILEQWNGRLLATSSGKLYEGVPGPDGGPGRFVLADVQPADGVWSLAASHGTLLLGNPYTVYVLQPGGELSVVGQFKGMAHLAKLGPDRCFVVGSGEIALLEWKDGRWVESAPRIEGMRYPAIVHSSAHAVWIEMGPDGVARLSVEDGRIVLRRIETPWANANWINVGIFDDTVMLTGPDAQRVFYDDARNTWGENPALARLLERSPYWIMRVQKDDAGVIWASHNEGVVMFMPKDGDYEMDAASFDLSTDRYPMVRILGGKDVWISTGRTLHHVEQSLLAERPVMPQPVLVSVVDGRTNEELYNGRGHSPGPLQISHERNSLIFRPFSGGYAWRRPSAYHVRFSPSGPWTRLEPGTALSVNELRDGRHQLEIRAINMPAEANSPIVLPFEVLPPWYRTRLAYVSYGLGLLLLFVVAVAGANYAARRRQRVLEQLVRLRTGELERTMERLNEETRNAATFAERNRLAGEIHDSLQQSLSGAMLQLDTTLKMTALTDAVRARLKIVRNMISFTRIEVQHAVWNMETTLLDDAELGGALRKLAALVGPADTMIELMVTGDVVSLPRPTMHHLLRVAQEALTNAVRHARARCISIHLAYAPGAVELMVADDGAGFLPDDNRFKAAGHFGLRGLQARAKKLGGALFIHSTPGEGTRVGITVPLAGQPATFHHAEEHAHSQDSDPAR